MLGVVKSSSSTVQLSVKDTADGRHTHHHTAQTAHMLAIIQHLNLKINCEGSLVLRKNTTFFQWEYSPGDYQPLEIVE